MANTASAENIARLISGDKPIPDWLPSSLEKLAASALPFARRRESEQLRRAQMRRRLADLATETRSIRSSLIDPRILEQLDDANGEQISAEFLNAFGHYLTRFGDLAGRATAAIPAGGGRDRAHAVNTVSTKKLCAMVVYEIWRLMHGEALSLGNGRAQRAANELWRMSGGPKSLGNDPLQGWRKEFQAIERGSDGAELAHIRQVLMWTAPAAGIASIEVEVEAGLEAAFELFEFDSWVIDAKESD